MGWVSDLLGLPPKTRTPEEFQQDIPKVIKIKGKIFKRAGKGYKPLRKGTKKLKEKLEKDPEIIDIGERVKEMIGEPTYIQEEPLTVEESFKKPEETLQVIGKRPRKQTNPKKVDVTQKSKKKKPKKLTFKEEPEVIMEPVKQEIVEVMITDQELSDATETLVKSSERFDKLMAYYDTMPEKIDGPITLDFLETYVAPEMNRFDQLMDYYIHQFPWHIDGKVDLAFLEQTVAPVMEGKKAPPPSLKTLLNRETSPKISVERQEFPKLASCPFHKIKMGYGELRPAGFQDGAGFMECRYLSCPVWCTLDKASIILTKLAQNTHEEVKQRLQSFTPLTCDCTLKPKMCLSKTVKNFDRVFLTCGNKFTGRRCRFFQWMDAPLWKPRDEAIPLGRVNFGDPIWGKRKERDFEPEMTRHSKVQQLIPYTGDHPADAFLSQLGEDIRAEQRIQQEKEFQRRCEQENQALIAANMLPRSTEFYKEWGFGCF